MHIHGGAFAEYYNTNPVWIKSMLERCDVVIALTAYWEDFFKNKVGCKNVVQVNNIISAPQYNGATKDKKCRHLLFLGKICKDKGIYDLIEVINEHKSEFNGKIKLHIGGSGEVNKMKRMIEEGSLQYIIEYEGWVSGDKKTDLLNHCDVYVLPSYKEGLPISILEGLSYGHYIISTTVGGIPEIITNEKTGILFTPGDKDALYRALKEVVNNRRISETKEARIEISKHYFPEEVGKELLEIYKKIL
jgi:glycosyltransferase involved in cell wall biosynthesis